MRKRNILIVDDHPLFTEGLSFLISTQESYRVAAVARNGEEALQVLRNKKINLILMDIRMPVMDGVECTRISTHYYPQIPVIAMSANEQEDLETQQMFAAGAKYFIHKGATLPELLHVIEQAMTHAASLKECGISEKSIKLFHDHFEQLTNREKQIAEFLAGGSTSIQVARFLCISPLTVKTHRTRIFRKLGVRNVSELVIYMLEKRKNGSAGLI